MSTKSVGRELVIPASLFTIFSIPKENSGIMNAAGRALGFCGQLASAAGAAIWDVSEPSPLSDKTTLEQSIEKNVKNVAARPTTPTPTVAVQDERAQVSLITDDMSEVEKDYILSALEKIPPSERKSVVEQTLRLITQAKGINTPGKVLILEAVWRIPSNERQQRVQSACNQLTVDPRLGVFWIEDYLDIHSDAATDKETYLTWMGNSTTNVLREKWVSTEAKWTPILPLPGSAQKNNSQTPSNLFPKRDSIDFAQMN